MRNDYLFKAVFQENEAALRELLAVLLHIEVPDIQSCRIENPIIPGAALDEKTVILDILLTLNDNRIVDIEMQVVARFFWKERSLNVLSLRNIDYATEEDRSSGLYCWAKFFSAKTWEELKMAAGSEAMQSAVVTMRKLTEDERIRQQCQAREDHEKVQRSWESIIKAKDAALEAKEKSEIKLRAEKKKLMELLMKGSGRSEKEIQEMLYSNYLR